MGKDAAAAQATNQANAPQAPAASDAGTREGGEKTYTSAQVQEIVKERLARAKAEALPSDYEELKAKAAQWDELEEANKTELEKATARAEKAEAELRTARHDAELAQWREQVAQESGVPASVLRGDSLEELQAHATSIRRAIPVYPSVSESGGSNGIPVTKEQIAAERDPAKRRALIAANMHLFN